MTTPPRTVECLLASLGAPPAVLDALLGDLAEEFAERDSRDGATAATRWYRREALRSAPHLLWSGVRALGARGLLRLCGVAISAYVLVLVAAVIVIAPTTSLASAFGVGPGASVSVPLLLVAIALGTLGAVAAGYVAAWLESRTPLLASMTLGVLSVAVQLVVLAVQPQSTAWYQALAPLLVLSATTAGGVLRVRRATGVANS
jgi:hypothetical protein